MDISGSPRSGRVSAKLIIIVVAVVVLALAVSSYLFLLRPGPEQVVRQFLMAEAMGDYPTMLSLIPSDLANKIRAQTGGKFPEPVKNPQVPEMEIGKAEIKGNYAYVPVKTKGPSIPGLTYGPLESTQRVVLTKEGGRWKVDPLATANAEAGPEGMRPGEGGPGGMEGGPPGGMEQAPPAGAAPAPPGPEGGKRTPGKP
jgi:hypothetical protein